MHPSATSLMMADWIAIAHGFLTAKLNGILLSPGGTFSIASLLCALVIALVFLGFKHRHRTRPVKAAVLLRALFPRRLIASRSGRADIGFFLLNSFVIGLAFGWALLSAHTVGKFVDGGLASLFGPSTPSSLPVWGCIAIMTAAVFVAFEFGYWLDHYLSHRIPFLWEFHKVHHTAESLSPLTNFRVHPVDTIVLLNILAVTMGGTNGVLRYVFGLPISSYTLWGMNALILVGTYLLDHLHHTHFWIPFRGIWGKIFVSPAHHQIHHSTDPIHFDKNMGSCLAVFDWMFGTLHVPAAEDERLTFGVTPLQGDPHSIQGGLIDPVTRAFGHLLQPHASPLVENAHAHSHGETAATRR